MHEGLFDFFEPSKGGPDRNVDDLCVLRPVIPFFKKYLFASEKRKLMLYSFIQMEVREVKWYTCNKNENVLHYFFAM